MIFCHEGLFHEVWSEKKGRKVVQHLFLFLAGTWLERIIVSVEEHWEVEHRWGWPSAKWRASATHWQDVVWSSILHLQVSGLKGQYCCDGGTSPFIWYFWKVRTSLMSARNTPVATAGTR